MLSYWGRHCRLMTCSYVGNSPVLAHKLLCSLCLWLSYQACYIKDWPNVRTRAKCCGTEVTSSWAAMQGLHFNMWCVWPTTSFVSRSSCMVCSFSARSDAAALLNLSGLTPVLLTVTVACACSHIGQKALCQQHPEGKPMHASVYGIIYALVKIATSMPAESYLC